MSPSLYLKSWQVFGFVEASRIAELSPGDETESGAATIVEAQDTHSSSKR